MFAIAAAAVLGAAFLAGWSAPGLPQPLIAGMPRRGGLAEQPLRAPGADTVVALNRLAPELAVAGEAPATDAAPHHKRWVLVKHEAPPPPDVGLTFRREASAIVRLRDQQLVVLLAADPGEERPARMLRPGDMFDNRWKLTGLSMDEAILQDGTSEKRVPLYGAPGGAGTVSGTSVQ